MTERIVFLDIDGPESAWLCGFRGIMTAQPASVGTAHRLLNVRPMTPEGRLMAHSTPVQLALAFPEAAQRCAACDAPLIGKWQRKYCSQSCYIRDSKGKSKPKPPGHGAAVSAATKGKPKPWIQGERNPNYKNKAAGKPGARERYLDGIARRGGVNTPESRRRRSELMSGPANKMRGKRHSAESLAAMSAAKRQQYRDGTVKVRHYKISRAEREIAEQFTAADVMFRAQHWVKGLSYQFDFFLPESNTLLEFQGNYWHANPRRYAAETIMNLGRGRSIAAQDIWERDARKRSEAEAFGFRVVWVWEDDYKARGPHPPTRGWTLRRSRASIGFAGKPRPRL